MMQYIVGSLAPWQQVLIQRWKGVVGYDKT